MGANLLSTLLAPALVLGLSAVAAAQAMSPVPDNSLRPSWSDSAMSRDWRAICGDLRNARKIPARSLSIRVQSLDSAGQVLSSRERYVAADVPAESRAVFCVPMPAGANSYNVTILHADWGLVEGP